MLFPKSIVTRVAVTVTAVLLVVGTAVIYVVYQPHQEMLRSRELDRIDATAEDESARIVNAVTRLSEDVQFLAATPPLAGIARARAAGGIDPRDHDTEQTWRDRLSTIFLSFIRRHPEYAQVRLIDYSGDGFEIVRIDRAGPNLLIPVAQADLQQKGAEEYVQQAGILPRDSVYLSDIDLNREYGRISEPKTPTIRAATPIFGLDGKPFAVLVINMSLTRLFEELHHRITSGALLYLTNSNGDYLVHPQDGVTFGFDLGRRSRMQDDVPQSGDFFTARWPEQRYAFDIDVPGEEGLAHSRLHLTKVRFDRTDPDRFLVVGMGIPYRLLQGESLALGHNTALMALGLVLLGTLIVAGYVEVSLWPLALLAKSTDRIADGEFDVELPPESETEVGRLSRSYRRMLHQIQARTAEIEHQRAEVKNQLKTALKDLEDKATELAASRDQAVAANRAKSDFLATMSHEIRTPMNAILGMTDLLLESKLEPDQQQYAEVAKRAGRTLSELIHDILDLSKIESGALVLESVDFELDEVIARSLEIVRPRIRPTTQVIVDIDPEVPEAFVGDPVRLRQVVLNLLSNAAKFTTFGQITLRIEQLALPGYLRISISDTGIGIDEAHLDKVFEDFTQADNSTTRQFGGTGLGLGIARRLVRCMGGDLRVESGVGKGSVFSFEVRLEVSTTQPFNMNSLTESFEGERALIIDDVEPNRVVFRKWLSAWGFDCSESASLREGRKQIEESARTQPFSLLLLDGSVRTESGWEAIEGIQKVLPECRIVMLSSEDIPGTATEVQRRGLAGHALKPVSRGQLLRMLNTALRQKTALLPEPRQDVAAAGSAPGAKLLIAEDSVDNQLLMEAFLKDSGHRYVMVDNGKEAVAKFARGDYDLVVMDIQMPVLDGLSATRQIRDLERQVGKPRTPVLALSANAFERDVQDCLAAGCDAHLAKPVSKKDLIAAIDRHRKPAPRADANPDDRANASFRGERPQDAQRGPGSLRSLSGFHVFAPIGPQ